MVEATPGEQINQQDAKVDDQQIDQQVETNGPVDNGVVELVEEADEPDNQEVINMPMTQIVAPREDILIEDQEEEKKEMQPAALS